MTISMVWGRAKIVWGVRRFALLALLSVHGALSAATTEERSVPGWGTWTKQRAPVFTGQYGIVGDPSVVRVGSRLRMLYGGFDPAKVPQGPATCAAESVDGRIWTEFDTGDAVKGRVILPGTGSWEDTQETPFWLQRPDGSWSMWFIGYLAADHAVGWGLFTTHIGYATAGVGGLSFSAPSVNPVLSPTPGGYDARAVTSPSVVLDGGVYRMIYAGWWNPTTVTVGITLMSATSTDGVNWAKQATPVFDGVPLPAYMSDHVAEPELVHAPDGTWYIFFSASQGGQPHVIGVAHAPTATGPWTISPQPIIVPTAGEFDAHDAVAPSVLIENGKVRLWYAGFSADGLHIAIGYCESTWPLVGSGGGSISGGGGGGGSGSGCGVGSMSAIPAGFALLLGLALAGNRSRRNNRTGRNMDR